MIDASLPTAYPIGSARRFVIQRKRQRLEIPLFVEGDCMETLVDRPTHAKPNRAADREVRQAIRVSFPAGDDDLGWHRVIEEMMGADGSPLGQGGLLP